MEHLNCFLCERRTSGGLNGLRNHFIRDHGLTLNNGIGDEGFVCGQNGCRQRFLHFYSLRRHIRTNHFIDNNGDTEGPVINSDSEDRIDHNEINIDDENIVNHENNNLNDDFFETNDTNRNSPIHSEANNHQNHEFDLRARVIKMIVNLQCKGSMTGALLKEILVASEELLLSTREFIKSKVTNFFIEKELMDDDEAKNVLEAIDFDNPFTGINTLDDQIEVLKTHFQYIEPIETPLGYKFDNRLDRKSGIYKPKMIMETFQYVSIIETLKLVISSPDVRQAILDEEKSPDGMLGSFLDGYHAQIHPFFSKYPHSIRIQLYYDELEIVSTLGSKTGIHKLGAFYYTVQNLPAYMNSELNAIHVLILCSDADVKKYGFTKILQPFLNDLKKLESDEGVLLEFDGDNFLLRGSIVAFCGDGLGVHDVFNLLGPSANQFCRMCTYNRNDLHSGSLLFGQERTELLFQQHLNLLNATNFSAASKTATGLHGDCCLHASRYFHISRNRIFDPMHDLLCGICPMIIKLVLNEYVLIKKKFTINHFNASISAFKWGYCESTNKPSSNFTDAMLRKKDHCISQKAMQVWCLIRAFPFLISDKINEEDEHMLLINNLLQIMEIVFAPKITISLLPYLNNLIIQFRKSFQRLFPNILEINKFHHLCHYPQCIWWSGPLSIYWCMRYEAKHGIIKNRAQNVRNFKNPPKTLIRISQCGQSARWGSKDVKLSRLNLLSGNTILIEHTLSTEFLNQHNYTDSDKIFLAKSLQVNGVEFRFGLYVCLEVSHVREDNLPVFACVKEIIVVNDTEVFLLTSVCTTHVFDTYLNAYHIERNDGIDFDRFIKISELAYYKPMSSWTKSQCQNIYISLRCMVL